MAHWLSLSCLKAIDFSRDNQKHAINFKNNSETLVEYFNATDATNINLNFWAHRLRENEKFIKVLCNNMHTIFSFISASGNLC